ncbi:pentatricopeptide repeat-containing protein At5g14080 [Oryza brachyantha]|nr:pentatricopeptide repeat-containing protein At5g14080 [Oryza brachyantha]
MAPPPATSRLRLAAARAISGGPPPPPARPAAAPTSTPQAFHAHLASLAEPSRAAHPAALLAALSRARAAGLPLLPATRVLAASALLRHGRIPDALAHFSLVPDSSALPAPLCNALLTALASSGSLVPARKVFDRMIARAVELDTVGFAVFVKNVGRMYGLAEVLRLVQTVHHRGDRVDRSVVALMVADGLCREGRIEDASHSLEEMRLRGWKPDFVAYRVVSEAFKAAGRVEEEGRILKQKRKLGVAPRKEDYREFVLALLSRRQIGEAKEIAEAIVLGDFPIDDDVLNELICSVSDIDVDAALMFCKFMVGKETFPSSAMLIRLCESLCKNGKGDDMWEFFRVLLDKGYCRNVRDYHLMVSFLGKAGKVREAYDVLKEVKKKRLEPDISSYNSLMEALCRNNLLRPAKKLWDEMFTSGCSPNLQTYNILITKFAEINESEQAQQLFDRMFQKGVSPDGTTYTSVINMLCQEKKYEQSVEIFTKCVMQDPELASSVLTVFMLALCKQGNYKGALGVISCAPSNVQSVNSHVILLKCLTDVGEVDLAIEHIKSIRGNFSSCFQIVINELMASLSTSASLQSVTRLISYLNSQGIIHDVGPWMELIADGYA